MSDQLADEFFELEFKYVADDIKLTAFTEMAEKLAPKNVITVSSWDHYYSTTNPDYFMRFRDSEKCELTIKRKTSESNNFSRKEIDLPLKYKDASRKVVDEWVGLLGYKENFSIYKTCFIYIYDIYSLVYYTVYNESMKEVGRFLEIEIDKSKVNSLGGVDAARTRLAELEALLQPLNISPKNRLKRSLWEIFRRDASK